MDRQRDGWMVGWLDGWMDGWIGTEQVIFYFFLRLELVCNWT